MTPTTATKSEAQAWADNAEALGEWAMRLVNRTDRYGAYRPMNRRRRRHDNKATTPWGSITPAILAKHFRGQDVGDLVGLHSTAPDGTCRWCVWDIDAHGEFDAAIRNANELAAANLYYRLENEGFRSILEDSNGRGGFHIWLILNRPAPAGAIYAFAQKMIDSDAAAFETYPKQAELSGQGVGNFIRLPGRHHTLDHWSKIYHRQGGWMEGAEAINELLGVGNE